MRILAVIFCFLMSTTVVAALPQPTQHPILTVSGAVTQTNHDHEAVLDVPMLEAIGTTKLTTSTPWTDGKPTFEGVTMSALMRYLGVAGNVVTVIALNDYKMELSDTDFTKYPVLLAFKMNGKLMRVRDKGPFWLIYPQDQFPDKLKNKPTQAKWVWQIKELIFH